MHGAQQPTLEIARDGIFLTELPRNGSTDGDEPADRAVYDAAFPGGQSFVQLAKSWKHTIKMLAGTVTRPYIPAS